MTNNSGSRLFQANGQNGIIQGGSPLSNIGSQSGYASTSAAVGELHTTYYRSVERTSSPSGVPASAILPGTASATFYDRVSFSGSGSNFSVTFTPQAAWTTLGLLDDPAGYPPLGSAERNFQYIRAELKLDFAVQNINGTLARSISMGHSSEATSFGTTNRPASDLGDTARMAFAPVTFNMLSGQTLLISGFASASVSVFSSLAAGAGRADASADLDLFLTDISPGWTYQTASGATFAAIPEPAAAVLLTSFLASAWVGLRRRRGTRNLETLA